MKGSEIKIGETYTFMGSDSHARAHMPSGEPFTVVEIKKVWRAQTRNRRHKVNRYFNADGVGARADELEPRAEREFPCQSCDVGEYKQVGMVSPNGTTTYKCDQCGYEVSFP